MFVMFGKKVGSTQTKNSKSVIKIFDLFVNKCFSFVFQIEKLTIIYW